MILSKSKDNKYDVIIIGSGPAGITTALNIAKNATAKIAIVESGGLTQTEQIQQLSRVQLKGDLEHDYFPMHTQRCFGGSSTIWGGFCAVLENRAFIAQSWPIPYQEINRWYPAAAEILELPENVWRKPKVAIEGVSDIVYKPFYISPPVRFNKKYHHVIQQHSHIHLILNQTCIRLIRRGRDIINVEMMDSTDPTAAPTSISADHYVLACGGIGNPRMLQLSGIGDPLPVGVGLMEHPHLYGVANVYLDRKKLLSVIEQEGHVVHALQLADAYCEEHGILSFSADFNLQQVTAAPLLGRRQSTLLAPVSVRGEIAPDPENRVSLSTQRDYLGQPLPHVNFHYRYNALANRSWELFSEALLRSGLGRPSVIAPDLKPRSGGHLMGTTRMGHAAGDSVVNTNSRVHTTNNLYLAGSSIFPAGGASNPTYTIVAMSLRLGDHIAKVIKGDANA